MNRLYYSIALLLMACMIISGCEKRPNESTVQRGKPLPIDGTWENTTVKVGSFKMRFDRGCVYALDANFLKYGDMYVEGLEKIDSHRYRGHTTYTFAGTTSDVDITFDVISPTEMIEYCEATSGDNKASTQAHWRLISLDHPSMFEKAHGGKADGGEIALAIRTLSDDESLEECGIDSAVAPGESRRTESATSCIELGESKTHGWEMEGSLGYDQIARIRAAITEQAMRSYGLKLTTGSEMSLTAILDDSDAARSNRWKIMWYKRVRQGVAEWSTSDGLVHVPFRIVYGLDFQKIPIN